ncbi:hypothetical protein RCL1_007336 [Eukaryota sp. TZLM3-RCL]
MSSNDTTPSYVAQSSHISSVSHSVSQLYDTISLRMEFLALKANFTDLAAQVLKLEDSNAKLSTEVTTLKAVIKNQEKCIQRLTSDNSDLSFELSSLRLQSLESSNCLSEHNSFVSSFSNQIVDLKNQLDSLQYSSEIQSSSINDLQLTVKQHKKLLQGKRARIDNPSTTEVRTLEDTSINKFISANVTEGISISPHQCTLKYETETKGSRFVAIQHIGPQLTLTIVSKHKAGKYGSYIGFFDPNLLHSPCFSDHFVGIYPCFDEGLLCFPKDSKGDFTVVSGFKKMRVRHAIEITVSDLSVCFTIPHADYSLTVDRPSDWILGIIADYVGESWAIS